MLRRTVVVLGGLIYVSKKLKIMREDPGLLLNKLSELVSKCRHENKFILVNSKVNLKLKLNLKLLNYVFSIHLFGMVLHSMHSI